MESKKKIFAYDVDAKKDVEISPDLVIGRLQYFIGNESSVLEYCNKIESLWRTYHRCGESPRIYYLIRMNDSRILSGFGTEYDTKSKSNYRLMYDFELRCV